MISLHGGHSIQFCAHADDELSAIVETASRAGMRWFGITEHAPKPDDRFLDQDEISSGFTARKQHASFSSYVTLVCDELRPKYSDRLELLLGMETDTIPSKSYISRMASLRHKHQLDFIVGSVHHVDDIPIDGSQQDFLRAATRSGGQAALIEEYYRTQAEMLLGLRPEVVGHFDLIRKNCTGLVHDMSLTEESKRNLQIIADLDLLLEVNATPIRSGETQPYPTTAVLREANRLGVKCTLGDDSHGNADVGNGLAGCVEALRRAGYSEVFTLCIDGEQGGVRRCAVPLANVLAGLNPATNGFSPLQGL